MLYKATVKSVLICDMQPVAIEGLRALLGNCEDLRFAGAVCNLAAGLELTRTMSPAVVMLDKALGTAAIMQWLHSLSTIRSSAGPVIWGAAINEGEALRFLKAGARGILHRTSESDDVLQCLRAVSCGNTWTEEGIFDDTEQTARPRRSQLTPRETQVVELIEQGLGNRDIGLNLGIRPGTVKIHLKHIFEKTGVRGRYGLALCSLREKGTIPMHHMGSRGDSLRFDRGSANAGPAVNTQKTFMHA